ESEVVVESGGVVLLGDEPGGLAPPASQRTGLGSPCEITLGSVPAERVLVCHRPYVFPASAGGSLRLLACRKNSIAPRAPGTGDRVRVIACHPAPSRPRRAVVTALSSEERSVGGAARPSSNM